MDRVCHVLSRGGGTEARGFQAREADRASTLSANLAPPIWVNGISIVLVQSMDVSDLQVRKLQTGNFAADYLLHNSLWRDDHARHDGLRLTDFRERARSLGTGNSVAVTGSNQATLRSVARFAHSKWTKQGCLEMSFRC
jgi:hypothetical protein